MEERIDTFEKKMEKMAANMRKEVATDVKKQLGKGRLIFVTEDQEGE